MPTPAPQAFRDLVETRLADLNMSKYELGQRAGLSANLVYRWWRDLTPTDVSLRKIAPVLKVPLEELMRAAGRLDADPDAEPMSLGDQEIEGLVKDFEAVIRDVPRPFWPTVIDAAKGMAEWIRTSNAVTSREEASITSPDVAGNRVNSGDDPELRIWKQGHAMHSARLRLAFVTPVAVASR
jgi:transcriptional regulator with XRE-family HTH domain